MFTACGANKASLKVCTLIHNLTSIFMHAYSEPSIMHGHSVYINRLTCMPLVWPWVSQCVAAVGSPQRLRTSGRRQTWVGSSQATACSEAR